ncbi:MAG: restriction endonuclease subunit S [Bacteroidia bacterium]|nr:restriction endonuclease subunit S [Bacteroidia bacterium]
MKSNYKRIGEHIRLVDERNKGVRVQQLLGLSISKQFIPSVANIIGTDMENYKIIRRNQFACSTMQVRRDKKMPVALLQEVDEAIISQAYLIFEVKNEKELLPEYLMMWFTRSEFDREACFHAVGGVRGSLEWEDFENMQLPIPHIEKQREIVKEYNTIQNRIALNQQLIQKLEETAQAIYREWFVEGIDLEDLPVGWEISSIGKYAQVKSGFAFKSEWWQPEGIPVIKIGSISNNTIDKDSLDYVSIDKVDKAKNYVVREGDIVIAMTGATIGKVGLVPQLGQTILVNQRVGMFDLGSEPMERTPFLYFNLLTDFVQNEIKNVGGDSAQANISNGQIQEIEMLYPTNDLIQKFNKIGKPIIETILQKIKENQKLTELKALLLSKLATVE